MKKFTIILLAVIFVMGIVFSGCATTSFNIDETAKNPIITLQGEWSSFKWSTERGAIDIAKMWAYEKYKTMDIRVIKYHPPIFYTLPYIIFEVIIN